jgi:Ca2+-binding RTX toxin-like protein
VESITFSDGVVWNENQLWNAYLTLGPDTSDRLDGNSGNNTLVGGKGNDTLNGWDGADTYRYQLGDGNDSLNDASNDSSIDQLIFSGTGLTAANLVVTRVSNTNNLQLTFKGITGSLLLVDQIENYYYPNRGIESITFSDGTMWNENQLWNAYLSL